MHPAASYIPPRFTAQKGGIREKTRKAGKRKGMGLSCRPSKKGHLNPLDVVAEPLDGTAHCVQLLGCVTGRESSLHASASMRCVVHTQSSPSRQFKLPDGCSPGPSTHPQIQLMNGRPRCSAREGARMPHVSISMPVLQASSR